MTRERSALIVKKLSKHGSCINCGNYMNRAILENNRRLYSCEKVDGGRRPKTYKLGLGLQQWQCSNYKKNLIAYYKGNWLSGVMGTHLLLFPGIVFY